MNATGSYTEDKPVLKLEDAMDKSRRGPHLTKAERWPCNCVLIFFFHFTSKDVWDQIVTVSSFAACVVVEIFMIWTEGLDNLKNFHRLS